MNEKEKMLAGKLYTASNSKELFKDYKKCKRILREYNATSEDEEDKRRALLKDLFGKIGENFHIEPPFKCDYGCNIYIGERFYANYDLIILDCCKVEIGDDVFIAPRVGIYGAAHPIDAEVRNTQLEYGKDIKIGNSVWIGANVVINPGVKIGNNVVIGSGSVVTKGIPDDVVAVGNPCRVLRKIDEKDKIYRNKLKEEYYLG